MRLRLAAGLAATVLLWGGAGVVGPATAQAIPGGPVPLGSWPAVRKTTHQAHVVGAQGIPRCRPAIFV
jgi:hypothetical protein